MNNEMFAEYLTERMRVLNKNYLNELMCIFSTLEKFFDPNDPKLEELMELKREAEESLTERES